MASYPPVRKIGVLTRSMGGRLVGGNRYESALERDFMTLMAWEPSVLRVSPQPVRIAIDNPVAGRKSYTPDVLVEWSAVGLQAPLIELVEVKYREAFIGQWRSWRAIARAASQYAETMGWRFRIITETEIRTAKLDNVRRLLPYRRRPADNAAKRLLVARLASRGPTRLGQLIPQDDGAEQRGALLHALWHSLAVGTFHVDLQSPVTPLSLISLAEADHG